MQTGGGKSEGNVALAGRRVIKEERGVAWPGADARPVSGKYIPLLK